MAGWWAGAATLAGTLLGAGIEPLRREQRVLQTTKGIVIKVILGRHYRATVAIAQ